MTRETPYLTKSRYVQGLTCPKWLWLGWHESAPYTAPVLGAAAYVGIEVGKKAHLLFPGGVLVDSATWQHIDAVRQTRELMDDPNIPAIFEAAFEYQVIRIRIDILECLPEGAWGIREAKSSSGVKEEYIQDVAIQVYVLSGCGINLRSIALVHKQDKITFTSLVGWPGDFICGEGRFMEGEKEKKAGVFIGPEFGTVSKPDLVAAAREAGDANFDVLIACAFNYDAHSSEFDKLGRIPVLKACMNPDLHMGSDLNTTSSGNLFVVFGEPDIEIDKLKDGKLQVKIKGVDVFHPSTGEIESGGPDTIALWFIDTDYNEESFFVRHAYFLGANDPYKALKSTLKAEIDAEAWESLYSDTSRPFDKPKSGRIAVKVINHLGDEVMKVLGVG